MSFGGVRHVADIRADDMDIESKHVVRLQAGRVAFLTNYFIKEAFSHQIYGFICDYFDKTFIVCSIFMIMTNVAIFSFYYFYNLVCLFL